MAIEEKRVNYHISNSYSTLNKLSDKTENIWISCHGIGFLSRYFIRYFKKLDAEKNYVIAPQAQAKYYQGNDFKYVGASWLTKEDTKNETENVLNYLDAIKEEELPGDNKNLILFGFSQGVSVVMRWMAKRKINCDQLVIYAGAIPEELKPEEFSFVKNTAVKLVYGLQDEYLTEDKMEIEKEKAKALFGDRLEIIPFDGTHKMRPGLIQSLVEK